MNEGALFIDVSIEESENVDATVGDVMEIPGSGGGAGTSDYRQLSNLPSLNGRKIIGDIEEQDPTVPEWAKEPFPPVSTEEFAKLSAKVGEMLPADAFVSVSQIDELFFGVSPAQAYSRVATSVSYVNLSGLTKTVENVLGLLAGKVEKESGKGLSTNDFDNTAKVKLAGIENGANKTVVDSELSAESTNPVQNAVITQLKDDLSNEIKSKAPVNSPSFTGIPVVPTAIQGTKTGQVASTEFVIDAIVASLANVSGIGITVVEELPEVGIENKLYMVPVKTQAMETGAVEVQNRFDEFMYVNAAWEYLGAGQLDLSDYVKAEDMVEITFAEVEQMFAESSGEGNG